MFGQDRGRGQPCKNILSFSLITVQNVVIVFHTVCAHVGGRAVNRRHQNFCGAESPAPWLGSDWSWDKKMKKWTII